MRNTITLNGIESSTIPGLLIQSLPAISKPLMRTEVETIDGRDGDITTDLGFSAYDKQISIGLFGDFDIDQIIAYFNSKGTVIFSNEPEKFYNYQIVDQIDFERLVRYRTATVTMHCQPFKYSTTEGADILSTNSNFATLDQSINSDASNFSYSSNVQADVTATRTTTTGGGKFFATFTMNVMQGVTYYFSGNAANSCTMYGYKDRIWGTSAGFSGRKLPQFPSYTATYTGTLIIGFYSVTTEPVFIRNFKVSNQSTSTVSGEGTNIVLEGTAEAPFSRFDLKGNTQQQTYTGKNMLDISAVSETSRGLTFTNNHNGTITVSGKTTASGAWTWSLSPTSVNTLTLQSGHTYTQRVEIVSGTNVMRVVPSFKNSGGTITYNYFEGTSTKTPSETMTCNAYNLYLNNVAADTTFNFTLRIWLEEGSDQSSTYEPYVGGTASPNPDYPQAVRIVTGENTVRICGKNLLNINDNLTTGTSNQLHFEPNEDGSFHVYGTASTAWANATTVFPISLDTGTYRLSVTQAYTHRVYVHLNFEDGTGGDYIIAPGNTTATLTLSKKAINVRVNLSGLTSGTTYDENIYLQLEKGSTVTRFEPYIGKDFEVNLGKNLFDRSSYEYVAGYYLGNNGVLTAQSGYNTYICPCEPNTTYTISWGSVVPSAQNRCRIGCSADKPSSTNVNLTLLKTTTNGVYSSPQTVTTSTDANWLAIDIRGLATSTLQDTADTLQIEKGSTATSYAPYFTPIELCKIGTYQDYFYKSEDKWWLHKECDKITLDDMTKWTWSSDRNRLYSSQSSLGISMVYPTNTNVNLQAFSDRFIATSFQNGYNIATSGAYVVASNTGTISFRDIGVWEDATGAKTALNGTSLYYALATPTDTEITNATLKAQLDDISQANAYRQRTHINASAATGNVPHIIAAEVATDPSGTITNSGNIYSKPKLTIFGSGSVGVYLNGVQMFQIALGTNDYITIDTAIMEAYQDNLQTLKNRSVTGDYNNFKLPVGESEISFSGNVTMCVVENYSRWL